MNPRVRVAAITAAAVAALAATVAAVVWSYPTAAECVASGRTVDATFRYCQSTDGYTQIREHALFHVRDGVGVAAVIAIVFGTPIYFLVRIRRRRRAGN